MEAQPEIWIIKKRINYIVVAIIIFISVFIISKINILLEGERGKIKRIIYAAKVATEKENLARCISFISHNYADKYGNDRRNLLLFAQKAFNTYENLIIDIGQIKISLDTDTAEAEVEATGVARNVEGKEKDIFETGAIKFLIFFQKEEAGWRVIKLEVLESQDITLPGIT